MKISILTIMACLICAITSYGQTTYSIKGTTVDTVTKAKLSTTITVLNAKDSILQAYTHTNADGSFNLTVTKPGNYLLWVTYPGYASYEEKFTINPAVPTHNFGNINLQDRAKLLQEVVIKGEVKAIKIKGDTTEYNAKAFVIQPNDKVEDLLRQLPDVHVDKDGKITAQGESVPKVTVDGEEFFGDDPLLVTRNIRADMVDKVQIFNKKSDQATFTGIDDGKTTKTINITLREDKKTGMFGKGVAGVGTDGYYEGQLMYNKFKGKYKFSVYGTMANDGKTGLGYQDASKLGASNSNMVILDDGGAIGILIGGGDALDNATYNGQGLPQARTAGVHYDTKWGDDKQSINTNYKLGDLSLNTITTTNSQDNYPTTQINRSSVANSDNHSFRQKADVIYQKTIDPNTTLKLSVDGTLKNLDNKSHSLSTTTDGNNNLLNREDKTDNSKGEQKMFNASLLFNKKFKKPQRTISWNVSEAFSQTDSKRYFNSVITTPAATTVNDTTAQYQPTTSISSVLNSNLTYTEPFSTKLAVTLNYAFGMNNSTSDRESYNQSAPGRYDVFDPVYSNNYNYNQLTNQLGAMFNYHTSVTTLTFGTKASNVNLKQIDQFTAKVYKRDFVNWSPQAVFRYKINTSSNYTFIYNGSATQPTIDQIQPIRNNTNLQNIVIGNANLEPSFRHNFSTSFYSSKTVSAQYISLGGNYSFTTNSITQNIVVDPTTGRSTTQYINISSKNPFNYSVRATVSRRIFGISTDLSLSHIGSESYSYSNNVLSTNTNKSYNATLTLQINQPKKYSFYVYGGPSYSAVKYSLQQGNNNSFGYNASTQGTLYLPAKFQLASDFSYRYQGPTQMIPPVITRMWNATVSKTFFKGDNLKLSVGGNNLLNQEIVTRTPTATGITQTSVNTIKRFFMFTISWDFTKFGTTTAQN